MTHTRMGLVFDKDTFILLSVHDTHCLVNKRPDIMPRVSVTPYGARWSEADVSRCERNEKYLRDPKDAVRYAASLATTLQTANSLGKLRLLQGAEYDAWHKAKFAV